MAIPILTILGYAAGVMGFVSFMEFMIEEALQTTSFGVYMAFQAKDWVTAKKKVDELEKMVDFMELIVNTLGWLSPINRPAFESIVKAYRNYIESARNAIAMKSGTLPEPPKFTREDIRRMFGEPEISEEEAEKIKEQIRPFLYGPAYEFTPFRVPPPIKTVESRLEYHPPRPTFTKITDIVEEKEYKYPEKPENNHIVVTKRREIETDVEHPSYTDMIITERTTTPLYATTKEPQTFISPPLPSVPTVPLKMPEGKGKLIVDVFPENAEIKIDGVVYGKGFLETFLDEGEHEIEISASGYLPLKEKITLKSGQTKTLSLCLVPKPTEVTKPTPEEAKKLEYVGKISFTFGDIRDPADTFKSTAQRMAESFNLEKRFGPGEYKVELESVKPGEKYYVWTFKVYRVKA
ncbi:MAG: hypothetical protein B6U76_09745 [Desulfurococcales archaeon ex4484_217_2]|nr:MAG: hypothetical protein B6U76_09745 [Desulfurococcales archaeon ex4484_217_2]